MHLSYCQFLKSAKQLTQLPEDNGIEVGFVGHSNVGKSSAINCITNIKGLAKTSKTPGCTQLINFFCLDKQQRLVDLPGYGYAQVSKIIKREWEQHLNNYFKTRTSLYGIFLVIDIRHLFKGFDWQMIGWQGSSCRFMHILLTKADKLKRQQAKRQLQYAKNELKANQKSISIQTFSACSHEGVEQARNKLCQWLVNVPRSN